MFVTRTRSLNSSRKLLWFCARGLSAELPACFNKIQCSSGSDLQNVNTIEILTNMKFEKHHNAKRMNLLCLPLRFTTLCMEIFFWLIFLPAVKFGLSASGLLDWLFWRQISQMRFFIDSWRQNFFCHFGFFSSIFGFFWRQLAHTTRLVYWLFKHLAEKCYEAF